MASPADLPKPQECSVSSHLPGSSGASHSADMETEALSFSHWPQATGLEKAECKGVQGWGAGTDQQKGSMRARGWGASRGKSREWECQAGSRCRARAILLPEDKVGAVDLPPTAAVLQDPPIAHHCTLLKLGPVVGHVLGETGAQLSEATPCLPSPTALTPVPMAACPGSLAGTMGVKWSSHFADEKRGQETCSQAPWQLHISWKRSQVSAAFSTSPGMPQVSRKVQVMASPACFWFSRRLEVHLL